MIRYLARMIRITIFSLTAMIVVLLTGVVTMAADPKAGEVKFQQLCATCHGAKGKGDGPASAALSPKPRDLTKTLKTDAELKTTISRGGTAVGLSPVMPAWGSALTETDIQNLIAYIRTLKGQ